jgi:hypothetical protein
MLMLLQQVQPIAAVVVVVLGTLRVLAQAVQQVDRELLFCAIQTQTQLLSVQDLQVQLEQLDQTK